MEKENKRKIAMIISLIIVALALAGNIYVLINTAISNKAPAIKKDARIVDSCFIIISLISSVIYISAGFKKTSAKYFKFFIYTLILSQLISLFYSILIEKESIYVIIATGIAFILLNVLLGTKDLGKKKSLILSTIIFACVVFSAIFSMCEIPTFYIKYLIVCIAKFSLAVVLIAMMILKYYDKSLRNTK